MVQKRFYSITELTREFGVSTRTLRFYEDEGLLQPERRGRTRLYSENERVLIKEILRSRRIGLTLAEIRDMQNLFHRPPTEIDQLKQTMNEIKSRRDDLRQKRRDIDEMMSELDIAEETCLARLAEIGVGT
ncbi:MerR family DNA-binding transcriptional regulator [Martelella lutilitoris]|uniref:MerR family DNA-binding transcriptional regulator n=1 Tax=Martelella lutilitoris TaxID=2583532 RepID=A0A5C4JNS3_9HYPH|nr:MerR family DNA-binding transcriptional regulator [Martelella lutilitoris]TNB46988.1 MerR family DNA-binding transcriptional regulator [Martelella lutilitoris]